MTDTAAVGDGDGGSDAGVLPVTAQGVASATRVALGGVGRAAVPGALVAGPLARLRLEAAASA
ncbi:MAG: hypothetical protein M3Z16_03345 [Pseudomonadota bacterium]|nr:hypothetical protein [Pseudomonadota bacterium]